MSQIREELLRRHFEEIFDRKDLAICDEITAEDLLGVWPMMRGLESRREEQRCRR